MPRRSILSATERETLRALPEDHDDLIRHYTLSESDLSLIRQHRGAANRLGFAVQLCYMRYPGIMLAAAESPPPPLLDMVAKQLDLSPEHWTQYGRREQTRQEHLLELQAILGVKPFTLEHYRPAVQWVVDLASQTDKGSVLAQELIEHLRRESILLPTANVIERICSEAITRATRQIYQTLTESLSEDHRQKLDQLLFQRKPESRTTWLAWLRLSPGKANSRQMIHAHIRARPGMYISDTGSKGLHHLVYELIYNSVDEALAGFCKTIHVKINVNGSISVIDDGRGIPVDIHPEKKISTLEVVLTTVGAGAKFDKRTYKTSAGLHGIGAKAVTALAEWTEAEVRRGGKVYVQEYERGKAVSEVKGDRAHAGKSHRHQDHVQAGSGDFS